MNDSQASSTALSEVDAARPDRAPAGPVGAPPRPEPGVRQGWTAGRITAVVVGALLILIAVVFLGAGGTALWAYSTQRDAGYVTTDVHHFSTAGSALATVPTDLGSGGTGWFYAPALLDKIRVRVTPASPGPAVFIGIARSADVDRYLAGVNQTVISEFWKDQVKVVPGGTPSSTPGTQDFWVASANGTGTQSVEWEPTSGSWTVVVMNADGRPGIDVRSDLGATLPALPWIALGVLLAGVVFGLGGGLLIAGAIRRSR